MAPDACWTFCEQILPNVSRSFALIIPQCPPPIDRALCVAYLICRIADTIEDEKSLTETQRGELYDALLTAVAAPLDAACADSFIRRWPTLPEGDYGRLIAGTNHVLAAMAALPAACQLPIRTCAQDMIAGMRQVHPVDRVGPVDFICRDLSELDRYCHYVAGTVGIMSTALFEQRFRPTVAGPLDGWREQGRRFGLGLQMTNIIKDCRVDAERGVSFIPPRYVEIDTGGFRLHPAGRAELIAHALAHLDEAWAYTLAVPAEEAGIRTFLLGSMLPAVATLEAAAPGEQFQPKISRAVMSEILGLASRHAADDAQLSEWYACHRRAALSAAQVLCQSAGRPG